MKPYKHYPKDPNFIPVDEWVPEEQDKILKTCKGKLYLPFSELYGTSNLEFNYFELNSKRCYNGNEMREHIPHYLNYFLKFYDKEMELISVYAKIKYMIDYVPEYNKEQFIYDLHRFIVHSNLAGKAWLMVKDNYTMELDKKNFSNDKNPALNYKDKHAKMMLLMSILMNMEIPLITRYIYKFNIEASNDLLMEAFDDILFIDPRVNIFAKIYETCSHNTNKNAKKHSLIWKQQSIRGKNITTHALSSVYNIILNIMPKYKFNQNIISFNHTSIKFNTRYQVLLIQFEYNFIPLSSLDRDEEEVSVFDKFESYLIKQNESVYIQLETTARETMNRICMMYGPINIDEVEFYMNRLMTDGDLNTILNSFQKFLIFNLFYKYFGDVNTILAIDIVDYVKLIIIAKKMLSNIGMIIFPYIISSKMRNIQQRKNVNKKELLKIVSSKLIKKIEDKYKDPKIIKQIYSLIATVLSNSFELIDYDNEEIDGHIIDNTADIVIEEILMYIDMI